MEKFLLTNIFVISGFRYVYIILQVGGQPRKKGDVAEITN